MSKPDKVRREIKPKRTLTCSVTYAFKYLGGWRRRKDGRWYRVGPRSKPL